jgi:tRNA(Ile)-lysidine synthase
MTRVSEILRQKLEADLRPGSRWCVALSGGLDSTVLLRGMCELREEVGNINIRAIHVNHGLHPDCNDWAARCRAYCDQLRIPLQVELAKIDFDSGDGLESAARRARYGFFSTVLGENEYLLTAHHEDDQIETLLLRLLRGSGTRGLSSIAERRRLGRGWLMRPLLGMRRAELESDAQAAGIDWIEDPSNIDTSIDRNYLRHEIVPRLRERWPGIGSTVGRAARLAGESTALLDTLADADRRYLSDGACLIASKLREFEEPRQRNVVRYWLSIRGLVPPGEARLKAGLAQLMTPRADAQPVLRLAEGQVRRYRNRFYILEFDPTSVCATLPAEFAWDG